MRTSNIKGLLGWLPYASFFVSAAAQIVWVLGAAMLDALSKAGTFHGSDVDTFAFPLLNCYLFGFTGGALLGLITYVGGWLRGRRDRGLAILSFVLVLLIAFNILSFFVRILVISSMPELVGGQDPLSVLTNLVRSGLYYLYVGLAIAIPVWKLISAFRNSRNVGNSPTTSPSSQG